MKNVTLSIEDQTLRKARRIAAERSTSLNAMIRNFLQELTERESLADQARQRIFELCEESTAEVGKRGWKRDELHER
jgi:transposase